MEAERPDRALIDLSFTAQEDKMELLLSFENITHCMQDWYLTQATELTASCLGLDTG
jgi:hypothetical protein